MVIASASDVMLEEGEECRFSGRVELFVGGVHRGAGAGTLMVTTRRVVWVPEAAAHGFSLFYPAIVMHAVSRDTEGFPRPCVYLQLDAEQNISEVASLARGDGGRAAKRQKPAAAATGGEAAAAAAGGGDDAGDDDDDDDDDDDGDDAEELFLVPCEGADAPPPTQALDTIYEALCACAALNPDLDAEDDDDDDDDEGGVFFDHEQVLAGATSEQLSMLDRYDALLAAGGGGGDDGRFDDPEDDGEEAMQ